MQAHIPNILYMLLRVMELQSIPWFLFPLRYTLYCVPLLHIYVTVYIIDPIPSG